VSPELRHVPTDPLPWQWHAAEAWRDEVTGEATSYLAGFSTQEAAERYGRMTWPSAKRT
jgi:hypothetical protein